MTSVGTHLVYSHGLMLDGLFDQDTMIVDDVSRHALGVFTRLDVRWLTGKFSGHCCNAEA